jgi:hypothetical protein
LVRLFTVDVGIPLAEDEAALAERKTENRLASR